LSSSASRENSWHPAETLFEQIWATLQQFLLQDRNQQQLSNPFQKFRLVQANSGGCLVREIEAMSWASTESQF